MAKEIFEDNHEQFANQQSKILYREQLEYASGKLFWGVTYGLWVVIIYASLAFLVVQQLRK